MKILSVEYRYFWINGLNIKNEPYENLVYTEFYRFRFVVREFFHTFGKTIEIRVEITFLKVLDEYDFWPKDDMWYASFGL